MLPESFRGAVVNESAQKNSFDAHSAASVVLIGMPRTETSDAADRLLDGVTMALQEFDTETLLAIADYRDSVHKEGWMQRLIREYVEVWR